MATKIVRIRERNQVTLPPEILEAISLRAGDFLEISVTSEGNLKLAPKRLVTSNTPEAFEADQEAERDIAEKRYATFENAGAFSEDLLRRTRSSAEHQSQRGPKRGERARILQALKAAKGDKRRAAKMLGMPRHTLLLRLKRHQLPNLEKS